MALRQSLLGFRHLGAHFVAVDVGQRHRVVDLHHGTRWQHGHTGQTRQTRQLWPQILDHNFLITQHFVHMQGNALRGTAQNHHRPGAAHGFFAVHGRLQQ